MKQIASLHCVSLAMTMVGCIPLAMTYLYLMKPGFIYIVTNKNNTTLYIGVTSNLPQRILDHKQKKFKNSFSAKYNLDKIVYWEAFQEIGNAIGREKQIKGGSRQKKLDLINTINPEWKDLYEEICELFGNEDSPF